MDTLRLYDRMRQLSLDEIKGRLGVEADEVFVAATVLTKKIANELSDKDFSSWVMTGKAPESLPPMRLTPQEMRLLRAGEMPWGEIFRHIVDDAPSKFSA